jgi:hypothetical protein
MWVTLQPAVAQCRPRVCMERSTAPPSSGGTGRKGPWTMVMRTTQTLAAAPAPGESPAAVGVDGALASLEESPTGGPHGQA